jgi:hypothetical protein
MGGQREIGRVRASTDWQQRVGELRLRADSQDYRVLVANIIDSLEAGGRG